MGFIDFLPIRTETLDDIRARLDADVNAGLDPQDTAFIDTTEGGFYYDLTQAPALEIERLWDFLSAEVPAAMFPAFAWGQYLDEHATMLGLTRRDATRATGEITFTGTAGTLVPTGTQVAAVSADPDAEPSEFGTTSPETIAPVLAAPTTLVATPSASGGTLTAATRYYSVTAADEWGETVGSAQATAVTTGSTASVSMTWGAVAGALTYNVYRGTVNAGAKFLLVNNIPVPNYVDDGSLTPGAASPPDVNTTGGHVRAPVEALVAGSAGNTAAATISLLISPLEAVSAVTNASAITGGTDIESDEVLRARVLLEYTRSPAGGTVADYERWALAYPGIGFVTVEPVWNGAGTVRVIITDASNSPVSTTVRYGLQDQLDPPDAQTLTNGAVTLPVGTVTVLSTAAFTTTGSVLVGSQTVTYTGKSSTTFTGCTGGTGLQATATRVSQGFAHGNGLAPIGATVTVATPVVVTVNVSATITFIAGYSLDGLGATVATRAQIEAALTGYINQLDPSEDVILHKVESLFFGVAGVFDVQSLLLNGSAATVTIASLEVARIGTITLV